MRHAYYASVSFLDYELGRVFDELERLGLANNTAVILHGDHGWQLGEHNSWHKFTNFELATRVPLIVRVPWKPRSVGATVDLFAELIDLYPTVAELVGSPKPKDALDGISLAPVFDEPSLVTLPNAPTENKTIAFSQFPHTTDNGCAFVRDNKCPNVSRTSPRG